MWELRMTSCFRAWKMVMKSDNPSALGWVIVMWLCREMYNNNISGVIPVELGNLTKLISLDLYQNKLTGVIPDSLGSLRNLRYLYISYLSEGIFNFDFVISIRCIQMLFGDTLKPSTLISLMMNVLGQRLSAYTSHICLRSRSSWYTDFVGVCGSRLNNNSLTGSIPEELTNIFTLSIL